MALPPTIFGIALVATEFTAISPLNGEQLQAELLAAGVTCDVFYNNYSGKIILVTASALSGADTTTATNTIAAHVAVYTSPGAVLLNPMTTKGDFIIGDTAGVPIRLAIGADAKVLTADAASTGGMKWAVASGGSSGVTSTVATTDSTATTIATIALTTNSSYLIDFAVIGRNNGTAGGTLGDSTCYYTTQGFSNIGGTAAPLVVSPPTTGGATAFGSTVAVSGSGGSVLVKVTGAFGANYDWTCTYVIVKQLP